MGYREGAGPTTGSLRAAILLLLTLWSIAPAWAETYRWVDERGRVHYSDTKPTQAMEQTVLDKQGRILRKIPRTGAVPRTAADDRVRARDLARERQDQALLSTYVHEGEIMLGKVCTTCCANGSLCCAVLASAASLHIGCADVSLRRNFVFAPSPNSLLCSSGIT